jgi:methylenetetrahydrofolate reductase (NADPH)
MTRVSIELVPRSFESLDGELALLRENFPAIDTVNIPDLLRMEVRAWEACARARAVLPHAIPHLRSMDFALDRPFPLAEYFREQRLDTALVVTGDAPQDMAHPVYPTTPLELIAKLERELPELRVYAGFDPYRSGLRQELDYVHAKFDSGADGLFSQPFFDLRLMEVWSELLSGSEVWWGISPVQSPRQRRWWETKNQAFFPADFEPSAKWNRSFARRALDWARERDQNLYFMPIRVGLVDYLDGIL